jgi:C4-dicarboxylate-binding protein DctP
LVLATLGAFPAETAGGGELPRLLVVHGFGEDHPVHRGIERLRERLAGVVRVEPNARWDDLEAVRALLAGQVDAAVVSPAALRDVVREMTLLDLIGLWRDRRHWERALDGEPGRQLAAMAERTSRPGGTAVHVLGYLGGTRRHVLTRREGVPTVEAFAALRLGIPINPIRSKIWRALGVHPVLLTPADLPAALRDGTAEGVEEEAETILRDRLFEAAPHLTETGHAIATRLMLVAGPVWGRLTRAHQAAVTAAARDATTLARAMEVQLEAEALASLRDRFGVTLYGFTGQDALVARSRAPRRRYAEELGITRLLMLIEQSASP